MSRRELCLQLQSSINRLEFEAIKQPHRRRKSLRHSYRRKGASRFDSGTADQTYIYIEGNTMRVRRIQHLLFLLL